VGKKGREESDLTTSGEMSSASKDKMLPGSLFKKESLLYKSLKKRTDQVVSKGRRGRFGGGVGKTKKEAFSRDLGEKGKLTRPASGEGRCTKTRERRQKEGVKRTESREQGVVGGSSCCLSLKLK